MKQRTVRLSLSLNSIDVAMLLLITVWLM